VPDLDHDHGRIGVLNCVKDAVVSLTYPILVLAGELFAAMRARIGSQALDLPDDPLAILGWESFEFLGG